MATSNPEAAKKFGLTNDETQLLAVQAYRDAAVADGWMIRPMYGDHESQDRAASLERDGYRMSVLTRTHTGTRWRYEASVHIWGPDRLAIHPPVTYDMAKIIQGLNTCHYCGEVVPVTKRVAFAGRACEACLPAAQLREEFPGWSN